MYLYLNMLFLFLKFTHSSFHIKNVLATLDTTGADFYVCDMQALVHRW